MPSPSFFPLDTSKTPVDEASPSKLLVCTKETFFAPDALYSAGLRHEQDLPSVNLSNVAVASQLCLGPKSQQSMVVSILITAATSFLEIQEDGLALGTRG